MKPRRGKENIISKIKRTEKEHKKEIKSRKDRQRLENEKMHEKFLKQLRLAQEEHKKANASPLEIGL